MLGTNLCKQLGFQNVIDVCVIERYFKIYYQQFTELAFTTIKPVGYLDCQTMTFTRLHLICQNKTPKHNFPIFVVLLSQKSAVALQ